MAKIKTNDTVQVIAGSEKGKVGKVLRVEEGFVYVQGVNLAKKHIKPNPHTEEKGGIRDVEAKIAISNVAIYTGDAKSKKGASHSKVGYKIKDGKKIRFLKINEEELG